MALEIKGIPVIDSKKPVTIEITSRDIENGDAKDPGNCAMARACKRARHATAAKVHLTRTYLKVDGKWLRFRTPDSLRAEIIAFDRGGKFAPGEYTLALMPPALKLGARKKDPRPTRKRGKKRRAYHAVANVRSMPAELA
jgi:hypothetical protein